VKLYSVITKYQLLYLIIVFSSFPILMGCETNFSSVPTKVVTQLVKPSTSTTLAAVSTSTQTIGPKLFAQWVFNRVDNEVWSPIARPSYYLGRK